MVKPLQTDVRPDGWLDGLGGITLSPLFLRKAQKNKKTLFPQWRQQMR